MSAAAYKDHPVRALVSRILEMQAAPEFADPSISDNEQIVFARDKVFAMAHALDALIRYTPAELVSTQALSQIHSNLSAPFNELTSFQATKSVGHLVNAAAQFEQNVVPYFWGFAPQLQQLPTNTFSSLLEAQATASLESIRQITAERDSLASKLNELSAGVETQSDRLDSLTEVAAKERAEAAATVAKLEQVFAQKETERASVFDVAMSELKENFQSLENRTETESAALIASIEDKRAQAARILQVVGNIGVTGNYQQIANAEAAQANFWRWVTVGIFSAGIAVAGATFVKFWEQPFSPENAWAVAIRLLYALAITAPAWYTARESARHRTNSDRARQTELELASIGPFIELMPEEKKVQIREQLTTSYFGRTVEAHTAQSPLDAVAIKDIAVEFAKALKK